MPLRSGRGTINTPYVEAGKGKKKYITNNQQKKDPGELREVAEKKKQKKIRDFFTKEKKKRKV